MKKEELPINDRELLIVSRQRQFYDMGFRGEVLKAFPNLIEETTAEEESQMIDCWIDKYCEMNGQCTLSFELREAMRAFDEICLASYRKGLFERKNHEQKIGRERNERSCTYEP